LYGLVEQGLKHDPMNGDLFLFVNESRKLCKVLVWDGSGLCIFQKRLARGCFAKLWRDDDQVVRLTQSELGLFIEGSTVIERRTLSPAVIERKGLVSAR
jgi:transposase